MNGNFSIILVHQSAALIVLFQIKESLEVIIASSVTSALSKHNSDIHFHQLKRDVVFERDFLYNASSTGCFMSGYIKTYLCSTLGKKIYFLHWLLWLPCKHQGLGQAQLPLLKEQFCIFWVWHSKPGCPSQPQCQGWFSSC